MAELIFIGTGSGKTSLHRFHSSLLFLTSGYNLLIDAGDGVSKALLSNNIDVNSIKGILITHLHPDHYTGLASLLTQMKMGEREKTLDIFANDKLVATIRNFILQSYLFPEKMGFLIQYHSTYDNTFYKINKEISFLARENSHLQSVSNLEKYKSQSFSSSSLLIKVNDKSIHYTSDIGRVDDLHLFDDYNCNFIISEITHIGPQDIMNAFVDDNLEKIIFTHISDENESLIENYILSLSENKRKKVILASEGLKLSL